MSHGREHVVARKRPGAIVNVSWHQAQRPVRGALPYATAKAAIKGLTQAVAVDHGPAGIRTNAVALGSIRTDRHDRLAAVEDNVSVLLLKGEDAARPQYFLAS